MFPDGSRFVNDSVGCVRHFRVTGNPEVTVPKLPVLQARSSRESVECHIPAVIAYMRTSIAFGPHLMLWV